MITHIKTNEKIIFLTIDDAPTSESTPQTLEILKYYNVKATFFCIGKNIIENQNIFEKILKDKHSIANHSFSHQNGWRTNTKRYISDVNKGKSLTNSNIFRPPYGKISPLQYLFLYKKNRIVLWTMMVYDFDKKRSLEKDKKLLEKYLQPGSIFIFHDNQKAIDKKNILLPYFIELALKLNFSFEPIDKYIL
ncbi:MAG TPA: polysaccharide deacetylase family protein [Bacteroidales bacterium]|jgi:peptidoglycan/xylan/chitin deacetylase (PgdA/CDA1 family)|nr:polysaccharide deacetylase family protein [Bacteroidales bacterium]HOF06707.1 polysaccharide deacetylase family protein [Bacteroidales bacterium]HON97864.1 polysaccharide deacetylase family protein [Bacteroidales bacterium]HOU82618.1 polysaccharide deacetylase family protein [Bacteroidales bacterium]HOV55966.1 polysaccharide deacetylase family protein [Bacteroidales bacterium]